MNAGSIQVGCPNCGAQLTIPVRAELAGRADAGVVQAAVLPDEVEIELQGMVCPG